MLSCDELHAELDAYLDGRLERGRRAALEAHCAGCEACRDRLRDAAEIESRLRAGFGDRPVPDGLWPRIEAGIAAERRGSPRATSGWRTLALAASLALAVAAGVVLTIVDRPATDDLAAVLVNELRTFVISRRELDVPSTDPLVLRGWFVDKVEFSPPAPPSAGGRLELVGGRLCNILDQRVISFMYVAEGHPVSLYVMRDGSTSEPGAGADVRVSEINGFTHAGWSHAGLRYSLVTDLPPERIEPMTHLLRREIGAHQARRNRWIMALGMT